MTMAHLRQLTLGVHPNARGFGWIAFESPLSVYDWGVVFVSKDKNTRCVRHLERLLERLAPERLILELMPGERPRSARVEALQRMFAACAQARGVEASFLRWNDVKGVFKDSGARTRGEIAEAVVQQIPSLRHRLPERRVAWRCEDRRMALFVAAALVLTHFQLDSLRLLAELRG